MQDNTTHHPNILKYVALGVAALVVIGLAGFITVLILSSAVPDTPHQATSRPTSGKVLSAADVIKAYETPGAIDALSQYDLRASGADQGSIVYKQASQPYAITISTKENALFYAKDAKQADNSQAVQDATISFMDTEGLTKATTPAQDTRGGLIYTTYENPQTVCQLIDAKAVSQSPSYHILSCAAKADISTEYTTVQKLLAVSGQKTDISGAQSIRRDANSKDNKAYAILNVTKPDNKTSRLLYAAVDDKWDYLGDLSAGDKRYSNAKYTVTPEIQKAISDPKYGGFLTSVIH